MSIFNSKKKKKLKEIKNKLEMIALIEDLFGNWPRNFNDAIDCGSKIVPIMIEKIKATRDTVSRKACIVALGHIGDRGAINTIREHKKEYPDEVRVAIKRIKLITEKKELEGK